MKRPLVNKSSLHLNIQSAGCFFVIYDKDLCSL